MAKTLPRLGKLLTRLEVDDLKMWEQFLKFVRM